MKRSQFTETQNVKAIKEHGTGIKDQKANMECGSAIAFEKCRYEEEEEEESH